MPQECHILIYYWKNKTCVVHISKQTYLKHPNNNSHVELVLVYSDPKCFIF